MINYRFTKQINPKYHYFNINFNDIKTYLALIYNNIIDYNSLVVIKRDNYFFTVDKLGHITFYYNDITKEEIKSVVLSINDIFNRYDFVTDYQTDSYLN